LFVRKDSASCLDSRHCASDGIVSFNKFSLLPQAASTIHVTQWTVHILVSVARNAADTCGFCLRYVCWGQCVVSYDFAFRAASIIYALLVMLEPISCDLIALRT
jgi:hypothetical protein